MKQFKEWLSDYLRYFLLLLAAILAFFLILAGVKIYHPFPLQTPCTK